MKIKKKHLVPVMFYRRESHNIFGNCYLIMYQ